MNLIVEQKIVEMYRSFDPQKIILFGSCAAGIHDEYSDIDLIIVYRTSKRFMDRLRELYMAWEIPKAVDILAYTPEEFAMMQAENPFIQDAVKEGKSLYERLD